MKGIAEKIQRLIEAGRVVTIAPHGSDTRSKSRQVSLEVLVADPKGFEGWGGTTEYQFDGRTVAECFEQLADEELERGT